MPISSSDVSALTGGFNQQVMMGMQHSAMLSQQFGGYAPQPGIHPVPSQGENLTGQLMAAGGRMGMSALNSTGINQSMGGIMSPFAGAARGGVGQMMYGAQQQQMMDANLRQSYRFANQAGGRGFTGQQMGGIGQQLRQMSEQRGPGGEMTSFEELGRLAANMGRMGMAENVRSVKDFNEKFKTMLKTVKTVAQELGTSLEESQKLMASLKGSGVFRGQGQFAGALRAGSLAGRVSTAELSGAAMIGSQISRGVGGLGSSGAAAGIEAMTQVGAARQAGVISEEDIYNSTGMSGAEGRRSWVQQQMSADARFFSRGIGRRALAAMAGKEGKLDQGDVARFMGGGVGTGETMQMAHENLAGIGRAGFIRNEGRLRGEAMKAFGGLGRAVVARNWLESRGMDMNSDRSMLFFQRKFKVGRDEADQLMKMARNLPRIQAERQRSSEDDQYMRNLEQQEREQSPTEIMKKLEMSRQEVNNSLRQMGADFYKAGAEQVNEFVKKLTGTYEKRTRRNLSKVVNDLYTGRGDIDQIMQRYGGISGAGGAGADPLAQQMRQEVLGEPGDLGTRGFNWFAAGAGEKWKAAGHDISGIRTPQEFQQFRDEARGLTRAFRGAGRGGAGISANLGAQIQTLIGSQQRIAKGPAALRQFEGIMQRIGGDEEGKKLLQRWNSAKISQEKYAIMGEVYGDKSVGLRGLLRNQMDTPGGMGFLGPEDQFATQAARDVAVGEAAIGGMGAWGGGGRPDMAGFRGAESVLKMVATGTQGGMAGGIAGGALDIFNATAGRLNQFQKDIGVGGTGEEDFRQDIRGAVMAPRELLTGIGARTRATMGIGGGGFFGDEGLGGRAMGMGEDFLTKQLSGALQGGATRGQKGAYTEYLRGEEGLGLMRDVYQGDASARREAVNRINQKRTAAKMGLPEGGALEGAAAAEDMARQGMLAGVAYQAWRAENPTVPIEDIPWDEIAEKSNVTGMTAKQAKAQVSIQKGLLGVENSKDWAEINSRTRTRAERDIELFDMDEGRERRIADRLLELKTPQDVAAFAQANQYAQSVQEERELMAQLDTTEGGVGGISNAKIWQRVKELRAGRPRPTTTAGKKKMIKELRIMGEGGAAAVEQEDLGIQTGLQRFRGTARGARAAQLAGIDVKASELKGKSVEEQMAIVYGKTGVSGLDITAADRKSFKNLIERSLGYKTLTKEDIAKGEKGEVGERVKIEETERREAVAGLRRREELTDAQQQKQTARAEATDPNFRRLGEIKDAIDRQTSQLIGAIQELPAGGPGEGGGNPKPKPKNPPQ